MPRQFYTYIMASRLGGTLYVGVTNDLIRRAWEHRTGAVPGFTKRHNVKSLVYFEVHENIEAAILREKRIKNWRRAWRVELIEKTNPYWHDLYDEIAQNGPG